MATVKLNVFTLLKQLELKQGHDIEWAEVARKSGISRQNWLNMRNNLSAGIDFATIAKLLTYFRSEGLDVGIADLFVVSE
jgi:hypothetical protein